MGISYENYIASFEWSNKRQERLAIDGYRCRLCDEDGARYRLEVHHRPSSYNKIPNESVSDDLITVCSRCHDFITNVIRGDRYGNKKIDVEMTSINILERQEIRHDMGNGDLQVEFIGPVDSSQRADGRPAKQVVEISETDFWKAQENGR